MDIGVFFVDTGRDTQHARAVCATCPVTAECLDEALEQERSGHRFGVRAGMSPTERDQEARRRHREPSRLQVAAADLSGSSGGEG